MTDRLAEARRLLAEEERALAAALRGERSRKRGALNRRLHEVRQALSPAYAYTSQAGQDFVVDRIFDGVRDLTFADIGGYDGLTGSNTLFLEERRGWTGILVEPVARQIAKARDLRFCPCIQCAVAPRDGEAEFIEIRDGYTQMSGLKDLYDPGILTEVRAHDRHDEAVTRVETRTLSRILTEAGLPDPHFVSLDIEGGELEVLANFPFDQHEVQVWAIENNTADTRLRGVMESVGYDLVEFCGPDEIYRLRDAN
ncbi:MAG: methyltransferase, FkbM family [Rhodobacteraceae bacterium HLUCCA08]|nr:MAG: methyltransferase, FkbM family [Rhodobacteraceae bacterium HLUCCA08]